ncbi:MAG: alpha/beta hydrolase family protein, partial [Bacilli bacterium]|nr:alpha/beta hydrolase family protein [Bacilli bacterium]
ALNAKHIFITGCSCGGTLSFYAACYDKRIKMSAPDCAFCPYLESILAMYHCVCNYIPHSYEYFDMPDLAALIAPRKLLIMAGVKDPIFPLNGVRRGYNIVKKIYKKAEVPNNVKLVETPTNHNWDINTTWPAINKFWKR